MNGLNIYVLAYRDWAQPVIESIKKHPRVGNVSVFTNTAHYAAAMGHRYVTGRPPPPDLVFYCGWSEDPVEQLLEYAPHVGVHCAESDVYSGGSPIQNQIIDGINRTKHRIFKVGHPELSLRKWSHEVDLDLSGSMDDILTQMTVTSIALFNMFLDDWPDVKWKTWPAVEPTSMRPRRTPLMSAIDMDELTNMTTRQMYDFFRCLGAPYPNGYIEDEHGKLYIERVRYKAK